MVNNDEADLEARFTVETDASVGDDTDAAFLRADTELIPSLNREKEKKVKSLSSVFAQYG